MQILKNGLCYTSYFNLIEAVLRFQISGSYDGLGNREQTHDFGISLWKKTHEKCLRIGKK